MALLGSAPGRAMTRDKVMGYLWPDKDTEQARHLLSVATYEIRKELGDEVVMTRGHDLVLDPSRVRVDVEEFADALERGDLAGAVERYAGPFLDGFHLGGSAEFDHWVDQERKSHEQRLHRALEALAGQREDAGDWTGAVDAWRELAALDRYNSRVATRLVGALAAAGNRAGALQFARIHEQLLEAEFDTAPPAEFAAAVEAVREAQESAPGPTTASPVAAPAPAPTITPAPDSAAGAGVRPRTRSLRPLRSGGVESLFRPAAALVLVALGIAIGLWSVRAAGEPRVRIAVMPMEAGYGMTEEEEAYGLGLSQELIDALGGLDGVTVKARSASFALRGTAAREAARLLGVDYVLEGSVRRDADNLRISAQLSDTDGSLVWTQRYDLPWGDVFAAWDTVTGAVRTAVVTRLDADARARPGATTVPGGTSDKLAYDAYVRGRYAWWRRTVPGFVQALDHFQRAVARDPDYALAWAGLSDASYLMGAFDYGLTAPGPAFDRAREAALRAVALEPDLAEGHAALANVRFGGDWDWAGAEASYRRALELAPGFTEARHWFAIFLMATGRPEASIREAERAVADDSLSALMHTSLARQHHLRRDYAGALLSYRRALELEPGYMTALLGSTLAHIQLDRTDEALRTLDRAVESVGRESPLIVALRGLALGRAGRAGDARAALARLQAMSDDVPYLPPEYAAIVHIGLDDPAAAMDGLEAAYRAGSSAMAFLAVEPLLDPLRAEPRFRALIERVGLPGPVGP